MIFYGFVGYINGFKKTLFYLLADIIIIIILTIILSSITISKYYTTENLLLLLERIFVIPNELQKYFLSPELSDFVYLVADVVVRLILFVGVYSLTRFILKHTLFKYLINKFNRSNKKTKKNKCLGSFVGLLKGAFIGILFVVPALMYEAREFEETNNLENNEISIVVYEERL